MNNYNKVKIVKYTSNIKFDEEFKTFELTSGNSLYAFCIGPELTLGKKYIKIFIVIPNQ